MNVLKTTNVTRAFWYSLFLTFIAVLLSSCDMSTSQSAQYSLVGPPTISAKHIDRILCARIASDTPQVSPACRTGQSLYDLGVKYNIDPIYALAWFKHESSFGRYGVARINLGLGNIRCTAGYTCKDGFRAYKSWKVGYEDWYKLIALGYAVGPDFVSPKCPCQTVDQIVPIYAPAKENNVEAYEKAVKDAVDQWHNEPDN